MYRRIAGAIEAHGFVQPFRSAATGLPRLADASGKHHDRVGAPGRLRQAERPRHEPDDVGIEDEKGNRRDGKHDLCDVSPRPAIHAAQRLIPSLLGDRVSIDGLLDQPAHRQQAILPAVLVRHGDSTADFIRRRIAKRLLDPGCERLNVARHLHDVAVIAVEPPDLGKIGRHDRNAHAQVLVQLRRIHVGRVLREDVGHDADIEALDVSRYVRMRTLSEQSNVRASLEERNIRLRRADEGEGHVRQARRNRCEERLIHPLMQSPHVADDRPAEGLDVGRRRIAALADRVEPLEIDAEWKQMHAAAEAGRARAQLFRRDEHEIGLAKQAFFARHDLPRAGRARGEVVDAVIDRHLRIDGADHVHRQRCRQKGPHDGTMEAGGAHPALQGAREERSVDPSRQPEVRQGQQERRVHEQVRPLLAKAFRAAPPVANALPDARQIAHRHFRCAHAGVLDEQHPVSLRRQPRHDFLMTLPDEIPVDGRHAEHVRQTSGHRAASAFAPPETGRRRYTSSDDTVKSVAAASE